MSLQYHYASPTTPGNPSFDVVQTQVRLCEIGIVEKAELGTVGAWSVWVDDPTLTLDFEGLKQWKVDETSCLPALTLTGTVAKTLGSTTIVGTGTAFTTQLVVGDEIVVPGGTATEYYIVNAIASDTSLTVYEKPLYTASGQTATRAGRQRMSSGYIADQNISRGAARSKGGEPFGRDWNLSIQDLNAFLHFREINPTTWSVSVGGATVKRPAETVGARLTWLLAGGPLVNTLYDEGYVTYPTTAMDAADYTGRFADAVLNEMSTITGLNHFVYYHEATGNYALFFNTAESTVYSIPQRISNVAADLAYTTAGVPTDGLTWGSKTDAILTRSPKRVVAGVGVNYTGGYAYRELVATSYVFAWRDGHLAQGNIKTVGAADALGDRYLTMNATQDLRLSPVEIVGVPAAHVNDFKIGARCQVRMSHLPGLESFVWARILQKTVKQTPALNGEPVPGLYNVILELTPQPKCAPCACPIDFFGDGRVNRFRVSYIDTTDTFEAFADTENHVPMPWLSSDCTSDGSGGGGVGFASYLGCENPYNFYTSDGNSECGTYASANGGALHFTVTAPAVATVYTSTHGVSTINFHANAFAMAPSVDVICIAAPESGNAGSAITVVVDGVTIATDLAPYQSDQVANPCPSGTDSLNIFRAFYRLPTRASGRVWNLTIANAVRLIQIAAYQDPDSGSCP